MPESIILENLTSNENLINRIKSRESFLEKKGFNPQEYRSAKLGLLLKAPKYENDPEGALWDYEASLFISNNKSYRFDLSNH